MNRFFRKISTHFRRPGRKGQSLVEIALLFPVLLIVLSGMVEFGFLMNEYITLVDAAREAARFSSDGDPTSLDIDWNTGAGAGDLINPADPNFACNTTSNFYLQAACLATQVVRPITLANGADDVVISVFGVADGIVVSRHPTAPQDTASGSETSGEWHLFGLGSGCDAATSESCNPSHFTNADINSRLSAAAPNTGLVLVEVFYDYEQVLKLPWITPFISDPVHLHAYAVMPLVAAEPESTPAP